MTFSLTVGKSVSALAGAACLATMLIGAPAMAMSLPTPSGASDVAAPVQQVWWDRWGRWHGRHMHYMHDRHRHCWRGRWGHLHCSW